MSDEESKVKVLQVKLDESVEKISNLEQLNIEATNKLATCEDTLRRQKDESRQIYVEYQKTHAELTELSRQLEREQEQTVDMHLQKALEKQRTSAAVRQGLLPGARGGAFPPARTPLGAVNTGGSPVGAVHSRHSGRAHHHGDAPIARQGEYSTRKTHGHRRVSRERGVVTRHFYFCTTRTCNANKYPRRLHAA